MLKSSLCDHSDACTAANNTNKKVIFKNCTPFTDCTSEIKKI